MIKLTDHQRRVMDHVLIIETPDEWVARNLASVGEKKTRVWLDAKVGRWEAAYLTAKAEEGERYRDAKGRHAFDVAQQEAQVQKTLAKLVQDRAELRATLKAEILEELRAPQGERLSR